MLILVSVAAAMIETEPTVMAGREAAFEWLERAFAVVFLAEYLARLWAAAERPGGRWRFVRSPFAIIDLLAIIPSLLVFSSGPTLLLRIVRLLRVLRIAKLGRFSEGLSLMVDALSARRAELGVTALAGVVGLLVASTLLYLVEGGVQPDKFGSIPRSMWWAVVTLTTIGYGDVFPITPLGKLLAGITAVAGIGLIAAPTGIIAAALSDCVQRRREPPEKPMLDG